MYEDIYEVSRDEFKGFIDQIDPAYIDRVDLEYDNYKEVKAVSKDGKRHFASIKQFPDEETVHYYVYDMPQDNERRAAKMIRKITLGSQEDVKAFFEILQKVQKHD